MIARTLTTRRGVLLTLLVAPLLCGCPDGSSADNGGTDQTADPAVEVSADPAVELFAESAPVLSTAQDSVRILALGDSLTAGYGLDDLTLAFPARLESALRASGYAVDVIDAGISGDTTSGGRSRLDWSLAGRPDAVIVELGANDGLRAIDPGVTYDNLNAILGRLQDLDIPVLLTGMMAPPNLGRDYGDQFYGAYETLAADYDVVFYPFFLDGVAGDPALNQADRIHPNETGVDIIVGKIKPFAEQLIERVRSLRASGTAS